MARSGAASQPDPVVIRQAAFTSACGALNLPVRPPGWPHQP
jgi:hypothetical protein